MAFRLDQTPLVDFCNQHSPRAHPQTARTPPPGETSVRSRASPAGLAIAKPPAAPARSIEAFQLRPRTTTAASPRERVAPSRWFPPTLPLAGT